jgi:iron complex transport system ATP-binding protein
MMAIEAQQITFSYTTDDVIKNVSLTVKQGEFLGIIGPNGAGKSTFLRILCGILHPQCGTVYVFDQDIKHIHPKRIAQHIGFVCQETYFSLNFLVEDIVHMGRYPYLRAFQKQNKQDREAVDYALEAADVSQFRKRPINSLSSGERQRVVIARTLAQEPKVLVLDEPTSHLDLYHQSTIMELLKKLNGQGMSIIIVNHDLNLAGLYCQRLVLMHQGEVYAEGPPRSLLNRETLQEVYKTDVEIIIHPEKKIPQILLK